MIETWNRKLRALVADPGGGTHWGKGEEDAMIRKGQGTGTPGRGDKRKSSFDRSLMMRPLGRSIVRKRLFG